MKTKALLCALQKAYPQADCALQHKTPFQLLIATILSAQCTDQRVNEVTKILFRDYGTPEQLAKADGVKIENITRPTGFFRQKSKSIVLTAQILVNRFQGQVPRTMEDLLVLRGVARKTANVVLGTAYGVVSGIVVDTHVKRLARRLGLTDETDPVKVEKDLMRQIPKKQWIWISHALIAHGRAVCTARSPKCERCPVRALCPSRILV